MGSIRKTQKGKGRHWADAENSFRRPQLSQLLKQEKSLLGQLPLFEVDEHAVTPAEAAVELEQLEKQCGESAKLRHIIVKLRTGYQLVDRAVIGHLCRLRAAAHGK